MFRDSYVLCIYVTNIMNVLRIGMNMSISRIRIWLWYMLRDNTPLRNLRDMILNVTSWWLAPSNAGALGVRNTPSLPLIPGPICRKIVIPERVLFMGLIELFDFIQIANKNIMLNRIAWSRVVWSFNWLQINDCCLIKLLGIHSNNWKHLTLLTCQTELIEIELFDHLTGCK